MSLAVELLGAVECERIARELVDFGSQKSSCGFSIACPWHREESIGACWYDPEKDSAVCFGCETRGDLIDIFCAVRGYPIPCAGGDTIGIKEFMQQYAPNAQLSHKKAVVARRHIESWQPKNSDIVPVDWQAGASEWVEKSHAALLANADLLAGLFKWGIMPDTVKACKIGWQHEDRFIKFTAWGLPFAANKNGRERCIHLPKGYVFPWFDEKGKLLGAKVRLAEPKKEIRDAQGKIIQNAEPKYKAITGGSGNFAMFGNRQAKIWVVTETERDAMLLWANLKVFGVSAMATGSASKRPDAQAHAALAQADVILNALDNDAAGARASWGFNPNKFAWNLTYAHCVRTPVPVECGKDVADLVNNIGVIEWFLASVPPYKLQYCLDLEKKARAFMCEQQDKEAHTIENVEEF